MKENNENNVYELVFKVSLDINIVTSRWIFTFKYNSKGEITKRKAHLVARKFPSRICYRL
jgi:hypothetical protein